MGISIVFFLELKDLYDTAAKLLSILKISFITLKIIAFVSALVNLFNGNTVFCEQKKVNFIDFNC